MDEGRRVSVVRLSNRVRYSGLSILVFPTRYDGARKDALPTKYDAYRPMPEISEVDCLPRTWLETPQSCPLIKSGPGVDLGSIGLHGANWLRDRPALPENGYSTGSASEELA